MVNTIICYENDVFLRNKFSTGLLPRCAPRNNASDEEEKKEAVVALLLPQVVASKAKQSSANNAFRRNAAVFKTSWPPVWRKKR